MVWQVAPSCLKTKGSPFGNHSLKWGSNLSLNNLYSSCCIVPLIMYRHPVTLPLITDQIMTWTWQGCFTLSTMQSEKYFLPGCLCTNCDLFAKTSNMLSSLKQTWNKMEKPWSFELRVDFNSEQTFIRRKIHFNAFSFLVILCSFEMFCFHNSSYYYVLLSGSLGLEINFWKFAPYSCFRCRDVIGCNFLCSSKPVFQADLQATFWPWCKY